MKPKRPGYYWLREQGWLRLALVDYSPSGMLSIWDTRACVYKPLPRRGWEGEATELEAFKALREVQAQPGYLAQARATGISGQVFAPPKGPRVEDDTKGG